MSLDAGRDAQSVLKIRRRTAVGLATAAGLFIVATLLPFAFRGVLAIDKPHVGLIACWTHSPTALCVYYYDYGNWLWLHSSPPVQSVALDNREIAVLQYETVVMDRGLCRQRIALVMDVAARSPGQHTVSAITITRGSLVDTISVGSIVFDAREAAGEPSVSDLSGWIVSGSPVRGGEGISGRFWLSSEKDIPLEVTVYLEGLPPYLTCEPVAIKLSARETTFVPMVVATEGVQTPAYVLVRPWLAVRSDAREFAEQPGPLMVIEIDVP